MEEPSPATAATFANRRHAEDHMLDEWLAANTQASRLNRLKHDMILAILCYRETS